MSLIMRTWLILILSLPYGISSSLRGADFDDFNAKYNTAVAEVGRKVEEEKTLLYNQYAKAVERLQKSFQESGDFKNALLARSEVDNVRTNHTLGSTSFPGIDDIRKTMTDRLAAIEKDKAGSINNLSRKLIALLEPLKETRTKSGALDEALAIDNKIKELEKSIELLEKQYGSNKTEPNDGLAIIKDSVLGQKIPVIGEHKLQPGRYANTARTVIGDRNNATLSKAEKRGTIMLPADSVVDGGEIFIDVGLLDLNDSLLRKVQFSQNLGGEFIARGCLFDRSTFAKGGAWGSKLSSRWTYDNCVFNKSFFTTWKSHLVGVNANRCTFKSIVFPSYDYADDAGKESVNPWWKFERCLFQDCDIPIGILLATNACVFDNCRFLPQEFPITTRTTVTVFYKGMEPKLPSEEELYKIILKSGEKLTGTVGASLEYEMKGDNLEFVK